MRTPSPNTPIHIYQTGDQIKSKRKSSLHDKQKSPEPRPIPPPFEIPSDIARQVITVTNPADIFSWHHAANDRKLRLLIRRFTNQMQYGCKNPNCTAPTCLSYRKRHTRTPLRKYTDVSARALACFLISEAEPEQHLCTNKPNVPWYEDTRHRDRRILSVASQNGKARPQHNGEEATYTHANGNGHVKTRPKGFWSDLAAVSKEAAQICIDEAAGIKPLGQSSPAMDTDSHTSPVDEQPIPPPKSDPKSFAQILYNTLPLRMLDWSPSWNTGQMPASSSPPKSSAASTEELGWQETRANGHVSAPRSPGEQPQRDSQLDVPDQPSEEKGELKERIDGDQYIGLRNIPSGSAEDDDSNCDGCSPNHSFHTPPQRTGSLSSILDQSVMFPTAGRPFDVLGLTIPNLSPPVLEWMAEVSRDDFNETNEQDTEMIEDRNVFIDQTIFYGLKTPDILLHSVDDWLQVHPRKKTSRYCIPSDGDPIDYWLRKICSIRPLRLILQCLRLSLDAAYVPPPWLHRFSSARGISPGKADSSRPIGPDRDSNLEYMTDETVAYVCFTCFYTLIWMTRSYPLTGCGAVTAWGHWHVFRDRALVFSTHIENRLRQSDQYLIDHGLDDVLRLSDSFDSFDANRLLDRIMDVVSVRTAYGQIAKARQSKKHTKQEKKIKLLGISELIVNHFRQSFQPASANAYIKMDTLLDWARTLLLHNWDGQPVVRRAGPMGGALQFMATLYADHQEFELEPSDFHMSFMADRLDGVDMPVEWLSFRSNNKQIHLLSHSFLFPPKTLVAYFRAINYTAMSKSSADARLMQIDVRKFGNSDEIPIYGTEDMMAVMRPHMAPLFVLTIRRDNVLEDAINQIWRRQRRELLRPLKVQMGMDEGEQGVDIGGVQQEFFRIVFAQAIDPKYGMFTVDETTRMTWFQPMSVEPLYKFEVLGVLMSIAVYNSITLPITFPIAFYRKLLGLKVKKLGHIQDGWPGLAKGLQQMLDWSNGDVADVFVRSYAFSFEAYGTHTEVNMEQIYRDTPWPPTERKKGKEKAKTTSFDVPPSSADEDISSSAPLVTNATRDQYIKDYIFWLTDKSIRPQYDALARGFYTCLDRTALSIFTPEALQSVIEGHQTIDLDGLERATKYEDGYDAQSPTVRDFWHVVRNFSPTQHRQLLEFVTANDRVPVNGIGSVQFVVQRNGTGDGRLPTSMTCFGRLLLPEYSSRQVLEERLIKAIENSEGFGVA